MKVGVMQPYFVPYIGYWQLMNAVDKYVIFDDVNFIKGGWINRNRILINGEPHYFNVPVLKMSQNRLINEIEVKHDEQQINNKLKMIERAYKKAPYYVMAYPKIEEIMLCTEQKLVDYIRKTFEIICDYLNIETELLISSSLKKNNGLKGQSKILEICKVLNATEYYNAIGGKELYCKNVFDENGIKLKFLKTKQIVYKQFNNEFLQNLSIIDVMMFNSQKQIQKMLDEFDLVV